jgi:hypothetical protein
LSEPPRHRVSAPSAPGPISAKVTSASVAFSSASLSACTWLRRRIVQPVFCPWSGRFAHCSAQDLFGDRRHLELADRFPSFPVGRNHGHRALSVGVALGAVGLLRGTLATWGRSPSESLLAGPLSFVPTDGGDTTPQWFSDWITVECLDRLTRQRSRTSRSPAERGRSAMATNTDGAADLVGSGDGA